MVVSLKTNVRFSMQYWMRLASIAMFGWTTTVDPLFAQTPPASDAAQPANRRLDYMKKSVRDYDFRLAPEFQSKLTVEAEPLLRFTNPVSGDVPTAQVRPIL